MPPPVSAEQRLRVRSGKANPILDSVSRKWARRNRKADDREHILLVPQVFWSFCKAIGVEESQRPDRQTCRAMQPNGLRDGQILNVRRPADHASLCLTAILAPKGAVVAEVTSIATLFRKSEVHGRA